MPKTTIECLMKNMCQHSSQRLLTRMPAAAQLRTGIPQRENSDSPRLFERSADSVAVSAELSYAAGIQSAFLVTFWARPKSYCPAGGSPGLRKKTPSRSQPSPKAVSQYV